jgi:hypothetical protein
MSGGVPRDPARIEPILEALRTAWQQQPDQRLGQLLKNVLRGAGIDVPPTPVFNTEDHRLYDALRAQVRRCEVFARVREAGLQQWEPGSRGKFLVTADGTFYPWRVDDTGAPHHQQVADRLGVRSVVDGEIAEGGNFWMTARDPAVPTGALMRVARSDAAAFGLRVE